MASLNLDMDYWTHPKTRRLIGLLGRGAEVLPLKLFTYCGKYHAEDGRLADYSPQEIETIVEWWGKSGQAIEAMLKVAFLEELPAGGYGVHGWLEHQGHIAVFRERSKKAAAARWAKGSAGGKGAGCDKHASSIAQADVKQSPCCAVQGNSPPTPPEGGPAPPVESCGSCGRHSSGGQDCGHQSRPPQAASAGEDGAPPWNGMPPSNNPPPRRRPQGRGPTKRDELLEALANRRSVVKPLNSQEAK